MGIYIGSIQQEGEYMITNSEPQETIETSLRELLKAAEGCQMKIKAGLIQAKQEGINEANANLQAAHKEELERVFRELESKDEQDMTSNTFTLSESMDWYQALKRDALHFAGRLSIAQSLPPAKDVERVETDTITLLEGIASCLSKGEPVNYEKVAQVFASGIVQSLLRPSLSVEEIKAILDNNIKLHSLRSGCGVFTLMKSSDEIAQEIAKLGRE